MSSPTVAMPVPSQPLENWIVAVSCQKPHGTFMSSTTVLVCKGATVFLPLRRSLPLPQEGRHPRQSAPPFPPQFPSNPPEHRSRMYQTMEDNPSHTFHPTMILLQKARDTHPVAAKREALIFGEISSLLAYLRMASTFTTSETTTPSPLCVTARPLATLGRRVR
jgi:hypothetical protein